MKINSSRLTNQIGHILTNDVKVHLLEIWEVPVVHNLPITYVLKIDDLRFFYALEDERNEDYNTMTEFLSLPIF